MTQLLDDVLQRLGALDPESRAEVERLADEATVGMRWVPNPGPQTEAYFCEADELFFGGGAGGGKTALLCGVALAEHTKAVIFRREYKQLKGITDELTRILGTRDGYNTQANVWRLGGGREIEFGAVQHEDDKESWQGRAHDLKGFDEITHFTESQYRFLIGWTRTTKPGQRVRVIATGNPPFTAEGLWVISYWAPWLDENHPNPAKPGELRWFTTVEGEDVEVEGRGPHIIGGREVLARSRTFIPSLLDDNPDLLNSGYASVIESMPEPLRTMMREGRFSAALQDDDFQVIPTEWIIAAQSRWRADGRTGPMTAIGVDVAQGGQDQTIFARRHGAWFAELLAWKGIETKDGPAVAGRIVQHLRDGAQVNIDLGGGWGGSAYDHLKAGPEVSVLGVVPSAASSARTSDGKLSFLNMRAEITWKFREALDPNARDPIALPPDRELRADLSSYRWKLRPGGVIQIESKEDIKKRIGRSPDKGDAVILANANGDARVQPTRQGEASRQTQAKMGHAAIRRRR